MKARERAGKCVYLTYLDNVVFVFYAGIKSGQTHREKIVKGKKENINAVPHVEIKSLLSEDLHRDADDLPKAAKKTLDVDGVIREGRADTAIDLLALSRDAIRRLDVEYKSKVKPINDQLSPYTIERNTIRKAIENVESAMADALLAELRNQRQLPEETKQGTKLSLVMRPVAQIVDAHKLPPEFMLPIEQCVDTAKVLEALKAEKVINDALAAAGEPARASRFKGVAVLGNNVILTTRLPEICV